MAAIIESEIVPGLVVQLDTDILRELGNARTNAERTGVEDRGVRGPHSFLVVATNDASKITFLCPLFSKSAAGSLLLDEERKSGYRSKWLGVALYYSRWQHWEVPHADIIASSAPEETPQGNRRFYAAADEQVLQEVLAWKDKNRAGFRRA